MNLKNNKGTTVKPQNSKRVKLNSGSMLFHFYITYNKN